MTVIAIDTSSRPRCVCVSASSDGELIRAYVTEEVPLDVTLPPALADLLEGDVAAVVVAMGPGSYSGVRSGVAAALGAAHARDVPLHGVGSLDVIAAGAPGETGARAWVASDAGRGGLWLAAAERASAAWRLEPPRRVAIAGFDPGVFPVLSTDPLDLPGLVAVPPDVALARAVPIALQTPPLPRAGLRAVYVE